MSLYTKTQNIYNQIYDAIARVNNKSRRELFATMKKINMKTSISDSNRQMATKIIDRLKQAGKNAVDRITREERQLRPSYSPNVSNEELEAAYEEFGLIEPRKKNIGEILTFEDVVAGKLPNQYPYYVQPLRHPRPPAKLIKSDVDVQRYLRDLNTRDTRTQFNTLHPIFDDSDDDGRPPPLWDDGSDPHQPRAVQRDEYDDKFIGTDSPIGGGHGASTCGTGSSGSIGAVAKARAENCLINIIRMHDIKVGKVYERFPHLRPVDGPHRDIFITHDEIEQVSKILKLNINIYTKLGVRLGKPWATFSYSGKKSIDVVFENEHAFVIPRRFDIDHIVYGALPNIYEIEGLVVDHEYYPPAEGSGGALKPKYYTVLHEGKYTMLKSYRPSAFTKNANDDCAKSNTYIFSDSQFLFREFKKYYDLESIRQDDMRAIVKASEHFIGREIFSPARQGLKILDHNKNYVAYKTCGYYMNFPGNDFSASRVPQPAGSPYTDVFVAVKQIIGAPWYFDKLFKYAGGEIILPMPVYKYLVDCEVDIEVDYWVASTTKDIDIIEYVDKMGMTNPADIKVTRNMMIGRAIGGGLKEQKKILIQCGNDIEFNQIVHECTQNNIRFAIQPDGKSLEVRHKEKSSALYQFHSYILGYAAIHLMQKLAELVLAQCQIAGFNVDSIFYYGDYDASENPGDIGGWKYEDAASKPLLKSLKPNSDQVYPPRSNPLPKLFDGFRYLKNTLIIGPPGIGKSHDLKTRPLFDQLLSTPTRSLREEHKAGDFGFANTFTTHKYIQFGLEEGQIKGMRKIGKMPRHYKTHVIDELTMFNEYQWNKIIERSGDARIIALGDFEQICNSIDGPAITIDYFKNRGFDVVELERKPDMICRHTYEDGHILDSLRGLPDVLSADDEFCGGSENKVSKLLQHVKCIDALDLSAMIRTDDYNMFVTDRHSVTHEVNLAAKEYCAANGIMFPVRDGKGRVIRVPVADPNIWWDRCKMTDVKPEGIKYEPAFAVTGDSIQGATIENTLYVDANIRREGVFYVAVTRTRTLKNIVLVSNRLGQSEPAPATKSTNEIEDPDIRTFVDECVKENVKKWFEERNHRKPIDLVVDENTPNWPPHRYDKIDDVICQEGQLLIHTEYPYRHFLVFASREHFAAWSNDQPKDQCCYHEVVRTNLRKVVIDIDGGDIGNGTGKYDEIRSIVDRRVDNYISIFRKAFKLTFFENIREDVIANIGSSGYSQQKQAYKFSLQLRTINHIASRAACKRFAKTFKRLAGAEGKYVDINVYKSIQNFRVPGSTKLGDNRHSYIDQDTKRCGTADTWVGNITGDNIIKLLDIWGDDREAIAPERLQIGREFADRIIAEAAPYTEGLKYAYCNGTHTFRRYAASNCLLCGWEEGPHLHDNMFVTLDDGEVRLRCRGGKYGFNPENFITLFNIKMQLSSPFSDEYDPEYNVISDDEGDDIEEEVNVINAEPSCYPELLTNPPLPPFTTFDEVVDCPKKLHRPWTAKNQVKVLQSKVAYITNGFYKGIKGETFAEAECESAFYAVSDRVFEMQKRDPRFNNSTYVKKTVAAIFAKRYETNKQLTSTVSNPADVMATKILNKMAMKCINKKMLMAAIMYCANVIYDMLRDILATIDVLEGKIMTVAQAKKIWGDIVHVNNPSEPICESDIIDI